MTIKKYNNPITLIVNSRDGAEIDLSLYGTIRAGGVKAIKSKDSELLIGENPYFKKSKFFSDGILKAELDNQGLRVLDNLNVTGDIIQQGKTYTTEAEHIKIANNLSTLNTDEVGNGVSSVLKDTTTPFSGWEVERGTLENFYFGFDEDRDRFVVGKKDTLQTVGTISDTIEANKLLVYDDVNHRITSSDTLTVSGGINMNGGKFYSSYDGAYNPLRLSNPSGYCHAYIGGYEFGGQASMGYIKKSDNSKGVYLTNDGIKLRVKKDEYAATLCTDGNLLLGTTTDTGEKLQVLDNFSIHDSNGVSRFLIQRTTGTDVEMKLKSNNYHLALESIGTSQADIIFRNGSATATERMRIASNGNVGIGTPTPSSKLTVQGDFNVTDGNYGKVIVAPNNVGEYYGTGTIARWKLGRDAFGGGNAGLLLFGKNGIYTPDTAQKTLIFQTNNIDRLAIDASGNVGIGTSTPTRNLSMLGVQGWNDSNGVERAYISATTAGLDLALRDSAGVTRVRFDSRSTGNSYITQGNIGIGTSSPSEKLEVNGNIKISDDEGSLLLGDGNVGIKAYHRGTYGVLRNYTGPLYIDNYGTSQSVSIRAYNSVNELKTVASFGGGTPYARLFYSGDEKFRTTDTGASIIGSIGVSGQAFIGSDSPAPLVLDRTGTHNINILFKTDGINRGYLGTDNVGNLKWGTNASSQLNNSVYHSGNSNKSDVDWSVNALKAYGNGQIATLVGNSLSFDRNGWNYISCKGGSAASLHIQYDTDNKTSARIGAYVGLYYMGEERFRTTSTGVSVTGNVGIGTTSPTEKLHTYGNGVIKNIIQSNDNQVQLGLSGTLGQIFNYTGTLYLTNNDADAPIVFRTGLSVERMRITSGGNVGIGTTSPSAKLTVKSDTDDGISILNTKGYLGTSVIRFYSNDDDIKQNYANISAHVHGAGSGGCIGDILFSTKAGVSDTTTSERMRITNTGNVGIGTATPTYKLQVNGTANIMNNLTLGKTGAVSALTLKRSSDGANALDFQFVDNEARMRHSGGGGFFTWHTQYSGSTTERMRIANNGNFGIGTTTPTEKLDVDGNIKVSGTVSAGTLRMRSSGVNGVLESTGSGALYLYGGSANSNRGVIYIGSNYTDAVVLYSGSAERLRTTSLGVNVTGAYSVNNNAGVSGTFTTTEGKVITIEGGIVTSIE